MRRTRSSASLPLPPYGARIAEMVRQGHKPNVFITAGTNAWQLHRIRTERLVLPPETDPAQLDWSFMRGLEPTIIGDDCPRTTLRKLAWCLLGAGCPLVAVLYVDFAHDNVIRAQFIRNE